MITSQWCLSQICHQKTAKFVTLKVSGLGLYMKCSSNVIYYFIYLFKRMRINLEEMGQTVGKDLARLFISPYKIRRLRCNF